MGEPSLTLKHRARDYSYEVNFIFHSEHRLFVRNGVNFILYFDNLLFE